MFGSEVSQICGLAPVLYVGAKKVHILKGKWCLYTRPGISLSKYALFLHLHQNFDENV